MSAEHRPAGRKLATASIILAAALSALVFRMTFFEFKADQAAGITLGNEARVANFLVTHGMASGVGVNNPPYFIYFMGLATAITQNPVWLTAMFVALNFVALIIAAAYFYRTLPPAYAGLATALLAFNPALLSFAPNIWAQCLLPLVMILFHRGFHSLAAHGRGGDFVWMTLLASLAAQLHMSGFFLFPLLFVLFVCYRREIGFKHLALAAVLSSVLFAPYLYHLFAEGELARYLSYAKGADRPFGILRTLTIQIGMSSVYFFQYLFGQDFNAAMARAAGDAYHFLYPVSMITAFSFVTGWAAYLFFVAGNRAFFSKPGGADDLFPMPFQISGFVVTGVVIFFILFRVNAYPHYFVVLYPSCAVLTAWPFWRIWKYGWGRALASAAIAASIIFTMLIFTLVRNAGGHPFDYGPGWNTLMKIREEILSGTPEGYAPRVYVHGGRKLSTDAVNIAVNYGTMASGKKEAPVTLDLIWNEKTWRYEWRVNNLAKAQDEYMEKIRIALGAIPPGAAVMAGETELALLKGNPKALGFRRWSAVSDYAALDMLDPKKSDLSQDREDVKSMLLNRDYGLVHAEGGVFVFKKGEKKALDHRVFIDEFFTFHASESPKIVGENGRDDTASRKTVRTAAPGRTPGGVMMFGPYARLKKGEYVATFRIKADKIASAPVVRIDVTGVKGSLTFSEKTLSGADFKQAGEWQEFDLPFTIAGREAADVEFRAIYIGAAALSIDYVRVSMNEGAFMTMTYGQ